MIELPDKLKCTERRNMCAHWYLVSFGTAVSCLGFRYACGCEVRTVVAVVAASIAAAQTLLMRAPLHAVQMEDACMHACRKRITDVL